MAFKIGDKVVFNARLGLGTTYNGRTATVGNISIGGGYRYGIRFDTPHEFNYATYADELTAVETLKLEKGATVRLKDGVDEWEVRYVDDGYADIARPSIGAFLYAIPQGNLVVVRGKPAPPKPDYYVNCKGAEPKEGDVFTGTGGPFVVKGAEYVHVGTGEGYGLRSGWRNSIGTDAARVLVARDGKPYVGG